MTTMYYLCAKNDINGNPRRVFVLIDEDGEQLAAWDESYKGCDAVPGDFRDMAWSSKMNNRKDITVKEYMAALKKGPSPQYAYEVRGYSYLR